MHALDDRNGAGLNPLIHPLVRLKLCALLTATSDAEFGELRDLLGISDSYLSKQLSILAEAKYVQVKQVSAAGRRKVRASLTPLGRSAFTSHIEAIKRLSHTSVD